MRFYTQQHRYTCGIGLHARSLYVCILDDTGQMLVHKNIKASPEALLKLITDYRDDLIIGVECMFSWYWIADFCACHGIEFVLGHAQYNLPAHPENLRYGKHREPMRTVFPDPSVQRSIDLDLARIEFYDGQLAKLEWYLKRTAKSVDSKTVIRLQSVHGIGDILSLVILFEIHDIERFPPGTGLCILLPTGEVPAGIRGQKTRYRGCQDRQSLSALCLRRGRSPVSTRQSRRAAMAREKDQKTQQGQGVDDPRA